MTKPNSSGSLIGRKLLAGPVLALSLSASVSYAATEPAAAPKVVEEHRIVIVERDGDKKDETDLKTRVIEKDGKTIVIKTDKALSEAEIDAKVEKALAGLPDVPPVPPVPGNGERRVIVKRINGDGAPHVMAIAGPDREKIAIACADGAKTSTFESEAPSADGKKQKVVMRFCSAGAAMAKAADGLKSARERISKDANLSPAIRDDILKQLDAEIEPEPEMDADVIGNLPVEDFFARLDERLAPVLRLQEMVKSIGDTHAELKTMYGGAATKDDSRAQELAALKSQLATIQAQIAQISGDQPALVLTDEVAAALKSAGPEAPAQPDTVVIPNDPNRPFAGLAAQTFPQLYYSDQGWQAKPS